MKYWLNISSILKKLLIICGLVFLLSACSKQNDYDAVVIGGATIDESCLSCEILVLIYDAVGYNVGHLHEEFTQASMAIVMVSFAIWLALRLLKFVSSVTETNVSEVWNEILKKAFICLICGLFASSPTALQAVMNTIVFPVYLAFLELGASILQASFDGGSSNSANSFVVFGQGVEVAGVEMNCKIGSNPLESSIGGKAVGFPTSIRDTLRCMIDMLSEYLSIGENISWTAMRQTSSGIGLVMGVILFLFFWVVKVGFVFYLVDCIFQMGIIILMLPLFIISYAFGPTKKWTGIGFSKIIASSGFMMCFSVIVALVLRAMVELIANNPEIFNPERPEASMSDISIGFICLLLIGFLIYGSMGVSQQLTSGLIGAKVDSNFQKNMKAAIQAGIKMTMTLLGALFTYGSSLGAQSKIELVRNVAKTIKKAQAIRDKLRRLAGRG